MKRFFAILLGVTLSATLGMSLSAMALSDTEETFIQSLLDEVGITRTYNKDTKELKKLSDVGEDELAFENMYLFMYENIKRGPEEAALEELSKRTKRWFVGYSVKELEAIVLDGDVSEIIERRQEKAIAAQVDGAIEDSEAAAKESAEWIDNYIAENDYSDSMEDFLRGYHEDYVLTEALTEEDATESYTQETILEEYSFLREEYEKELEFQRDNRKIAYQTLANEIFYNNDLSDSANIDILYDLDLINYLLFNEYIAYPDRSSGGSVQLASERSEPAVQLAQEEDDEEEEFSSYACLEDETLREALEAFEEYEETLEEEESEEDADEEEEEEEVTEDEDGTSISDTTVEGQNLDDLDDLISALTGEKGDWSRSLPCGEIFCITINLVTEEGDSIRVEESFDKEANCIACHTSYIKERLQDTMSKSLVPSKVSMNWFEDATCKEAGKFVNLDLNVYGIKVPITLDPNDDTEEIPQSEIDDLKTKLIGYGGFSFPGGSKTTLGSTLKDIECDAILNLIETGDVQKDVDQAIAKCTKAGDIIEEQLDEIIEEFIYEATASNDDALYQQVAAELYTMLLYFESFNDALHDTYEDGPAPLSSLMSKGYCQ